MSAGGPIRVLFVCTANICRSAYAEVLARHVLGNTGGGRGSDTGGEPGVVFASAGVHGLVDHPIDEAIAGQLRERGVAGADAFRSRRLTLAMVDEADLVLTAEARHRQYILDDRPAAFRRVLTLGQLDRVLDQVPEDLRGHELLEAVGRALPPATAADDVPDPYRRGAEAAATAAGRLESVVTRLVPRLASAA